MTNGIDGTANGSEWQTTADAEGRAADLLFAALHGSSPRRSRRWTRTRPAYQNGFPSEASEASEASDMEATPDESNHVEVIDPEAIGESSDVEAIDTEATPDESNDVEVIDPEATPDESNDVEVIDTEACAADEPAEQANTRERAVHLTELRAHASTGTTYKLDGDNCVLRWARLPSQCAGPVDVVVHFHGYDPHNRMRLQNKANLSGLDLDTPGVTRPTAGLIPHGHAFPSSLDCSGSRVPCPRDTWRAQCPGGGGPTTCPDGFDFPALEERAKLLAFVDNGLKGVATACGTTSGTFTRARLVLTGHSGGGAPLRKLVQAFGAADEVSGFQFFDATYGDQSSVTAQGGWVELNLQRDAALLARTPQADWPNKMLESGHHLRVIFIENTGTAAGALAIRDFLAQKLALVTSEPIRAFLSRYYRVQASVSRDHNGVPRSAGGRLLANPGDDLGGIARAPASAPTRSTTPPTGAPARTTTPPAPQRREEMPSAGEDSAEVPAASDAGVDTSPLAQEELAPFARIPIASARDLHAFFERSGSAGFTAWYNEHLAGKEPFTRRGHAIRMPDDAATRRRFDQFWNQIPAAYGRPSITLPDFAALFCVVLNETGGRFEGVAERCVPGRRDALGEHAGLAYAFDKIIDGKKSYNTKPGNRSAGSLFDDPEFIAAHGRLAGADRLARRGNDSNRVWHGELFPQDSFSPIEDPNVNGFLMQADFYKFRGRGVIQTTGRGPYVKIVRFIQQYQGPSATVREFRDRFSNLEPDSAATRSTTADWDRLFHDPEILATGPALHCRRGGVDYRIMAPRAEILNHVPAAAGNPQGTPGSIYAFGRCVSARYRYCAGIYRDRVLALLHRAATLT